MLLHTVLPAGYITSCRMSQHHITPRLPPACTADPAALPGPDVPPRLAATQSPNVAVQNLIQMAVLVLVIAALHLLLVVLWRTLSWTSAKPLPDFLAFPNPELKLLHMLALPVAIYGIILLLQGVNTWQRALGSVVIALVGCYVVFVALAIVQVHVNGAKLGVQYVLLGAGAQKVAGGPAIDGLVMEEIGGKRPPHGFWYRLLVTDGADERLLKMQRKGGGAGAAVLSRCCAVLPAVVALCAADGCRWYDCSLRMSATCCEWSQCQRGWCCDRVVWRC